MEKFEFPSQHRCNLNIKRVNRTRETYYVVQQYVASLNITRDRYFIKWFFIYLPTLEGEMIKTSHVTNVGFPTFANKNIHFQYANIYFFIVALKKCAPTFIF